MLYQKKFLVLLTFISLMLTPLAVQAATITFHPARISVHQGESFSINVGISAPNAKAYTVKVIASFTSKFFNISDWKFNPAWIVLSQKGYESLDNEKGTLVRTAGYPKGFTGTMSFGTVTFKALDIGKGAITLNSDSFIYNESNNNTYAGANEVIVEVLPAVIGKNDGLKPDESLQSSLSNKTIPNELQDQTSEQHPAATEVLPHRYQQSILLEKPGLSSGTHRPSLFDVSAEIAPPPNSNPLFYLIIIAIGGILCGVGFITLFEKYKQQRILRRKRKT